ARDPLDLGRVEGGVGLLVEQGAQLAVVEGGERPRQPVAEVGVRRVKHQIGKRLTDRSGQSQVVEPPGGGGTRRGLALADLVAVDDQHLRAGASELAGNGQSGEARSADEYVA